MNTRPFRHWLFMNVALDIFAPMAVLAVAVLAVVFVALSR
jgi:hypothetical protein